MAGELSGSLLSFYRETSSDIYKFCRALNFHPTWQQELVLDAVQRNADTYGAECKRIACKSGKGPGKTTVASIIALWRPYRTVKGLTVATAPTMRQCFDILLTECRQRMQAADPKLQRLIEVTKSRVIIGGDDDWGVKFVTATKEENAQGYHRPNLTVVADEASGIPRNIMRAFQDTLSNQDSLFLAIGNPNTRDCMFFDCFNSQRHEWYTITLNAEESPAHIVDPERNRLIEAEFGKDSDVYRIAVLGEFPHSDPNCVMSSDELERITNKVLVRAAVVFCPVKQFGLDLARYGGDESVIVRRSGNAALEMEKYAHMDPSQVIDRSFLMQHQAGWSNADCHFVVDAGGMGQGSMHRFYDAGKHVFEFHNNGKSSDIQYENKITEAWFTFAKKIRSVPVSIPNDNRLIQQLSQRRYYTTKKGKLVLETKDEYMKRGFDSPDRADATVMAFYDNIAGLANYAVKGPGSTNVGMKVRAA